MIDTHITNRADAPVRLARLVPSVLSALTDDEAPSTFAAFTPDAVAITSHLGTIHGGARIVEALRTATPAASVAQYRLSNVHTAIRGAKAVQSSYLLGTFADETPAGELEPFLFGGHQTVRFVCINDAWRIDEWRLDLDWHHGAAAMVPTWQLPDGAAGWHRGWREPAVIAELDSPWRAIQEPEETGTVEDSVRSAYFRYAWALDQADFPLLTTAFTEDAQADMAPFGRMDSRREIVASLKALRNGQPYMQHAAPELHVSVDGDRAVMQIYREVPFVPTKESLEARVYGAQYESRLRFEGGLWKFEWLHYVPGWITLDDAQADD